MKGVIYNYKQEKTYLGLEYLGSSIGGGDEQRGGGGGGIRGGGELYFISM